jgi:hypothetical protein
VLVVDNAAEKLATIKFKLSIETMVNRSCNSLTLSVADVPRYEAEVSALSFPATITNAQVLKFGPYKVKKLIEGQTVVSTGSGGTCLKYDVTNAQCNDRRSVAMPRPKNHWFAVVAGAGKDGRRKDYVISHANAFGLQSSSPSQLTADAINADITAKTGLYKYYKPVKQADIVSAAFDNALAGAEFSAKDQVTISGIDEFKAYSIEELWVHGFMEVTEADLNKLPEARWLALVTATKDGSSTAFIVTGGADYFYSASRPAQSKFFTWDAVKADRTQGTDLYDIYTFVGSLIKPASCQAQLTYFLDDVSAMTESNLPAKDQPQGGADALLNACELEPMVTTLDQHAIAAKFYLWAWHKY